MTSFEITIIALLTIIIFSQIVTTSLLVDIINIIKVLMDMVMIVKIVVKFVMISGKKIILRNIKHR